MTSCEPARHAPTGCPQIDTWIADVRAERIRTNQWIKLACDLIERKLARPGIVIRQDMIDRAIELAERYFFRLFPWEALVVALLHCYHEPTDTVVWRRIDLVVGRGAGKNGFISFLIWYFTTVDHGIKGYNVDLVANSEEQAQRSFGDVWQMLDDNATKMERLFSWTKTEIVSKRTRSYIKYNTANAKTKDSKRTACVVFDEFHAYENYEQISVFQSGMGKVKHGRQLWISSNGKVRGAVFDQELEANKNILLGERNANRRLPLLWMLETAEQAQDPENWVIANPSLPYFPELQIEVESNWIEAQDQPELMQEFMTKRMGLPLENPDVVVTSWENILRASRPLPDLVGRECVFGVDFAKTTDFVSAGLWFRDGDERYWLKKTWACRQSGDWSRIKAPLEEWYRAGHLEIVDDVEISPRIVAEWLRARTMEYQVIGGAIDSYRYTLMSEALEELGFVAGENLRLVRGAQIMKIAPMITSLFATGNLAYGDDPEMRWAVNNAKQISSGRDRDLGNYTFGKQEKHSRKTDSFQAMVTAACCDDMLAAQSNILVDLGSVVW